MSSPLLLAAVESLATKRVGKFGLIGAVSDACVPGGCVAGEASFSLDANFLSAAAQAAMPVVIAMHNKKGVSVRMDLFIPFPHAKRGHVHGQSEGIYDDFVLTHGTAIAEA